MTLNGVKVLSIITLNLLAFKANCVKLVEDRPVLSATKMLFKESSFWQCMTFGDITKNE